MKSASERDKRKKGMVVIVTAVSLLFIIPVIGLAIDAGMLYAIKAKLSAAADAASLASARSLSVGLTLAAQETSARNTAQRFFSANFPDGYMNTRNSSVAIAVAETAYRTRTVTTTASVDAPSYFMKVLGFNTTTVRAEGKASRRDVNLLLVLDRSSSMQASGSCQPMKDAATQFVNQFANQRDRLGMIVFGTNTVLAFPPDQNFQTAAPATLPQRISQITCGTNTNSAQALWLAYQQLVTINEVGTLNLVVFFTDGLPNGVNASFPVKKSTDTRYGYGADGYTNQGSTYSIPPSPCTFHDANGYDQAYNHDPHTGMNYTGPWNPNWQPPDKAGVLAQWAGFAATGTTAGLFKDIVPPPTGSSMPDLNAYTIANVPGCAMAAGQGRVRRDIAYIPNQDVYGNATTCCYKAVETFTAAPYNGMIRPDKPSSIGSASFNAADSAATRIRDSALGVVIYTIGLGSSTGGEAPDEVFMRRISNDPASPDYNSAKPAGLYVYAPNSTQLAQAFAQVASEILRLAR